MELKYRVQYIMGSRVLCVFCFEICSRGENEVHRTFDPINTLSRILISPHHLVVTHRLNNPWPRLVLVTPVRDPRAAQIKHWRCRLPAVKSSGLGRSQPRGHSQRECGEFRELKTTSVNSYFSQLPSIYLRRYDVALKLNFTRKCSCTQPYFPS